MVKRTLLSLFIRGSIDEAIDSGIGKGNYNHPTINRPVLTQSQTEYVEYKSEMFLANILQRASQLMAWACRRALPEDVQR